MSSDLKNLLEVAEVAWAVSAHAKRNLYSLAEDAIKGKASRSVWESSLNDARQKAKHSALQAQIAYHAHRGGKGDDEDYQQTELLVSLSAKLEKELSSITPRKLILEETVCVS
jgi:hypothetical protein